MAERTKMSKTADESPAVEPSPGSGSRAKDPLPDLRQPAKGSGSELAGQTKTPPAGLTDIPPDVEGYEVYYSAECPLGCYVPVPTENP
jgi:hypothetical protein